MQKQLSPYQEVLKYEKENSTPSPLPTANEFLKLCEVEENNIESLKKMQSLVMESLYVNLSNSLPKRHLLQQTKNLLETKIQKLQ